MTALVGVIGGMGPAATARFSTLLVERADVRRDQDHVRTLVLNDAALPDRTAFLLGRSPASPAPGLAADARVLQDAGCAFLALPCNTAHAFAGAIRQAVSVPLVSMIDEAAAACQALGLARVGVLATEGTATAGLYDHALAARGIECAYPSPALQARVTALIYEGVKAGAPVPSVAVALLCARLAAEEGCAGVVLGCTELSCAWHAAETPGGVAVVDSLAALADAVILRAGGRLRPGIATTRPARTSDAAGSAAAAARQNRAASAVAAPGSRGPATAAGDDAQVRPRADRNRASSSHPSREEAPCAAS